MRVTRARSRVTPITITQNDGCCDPQCDRYPIGMRGYRRVRRHSTKAGVDEILARDGLFAHALDSLAQQANPWFPNAMEDAMGELTPEDIYQSFGE